MKTLIQITNLYKQYNTRTIFENASLHILEGQKIGCIGRNGAGKSTFCKMLIDQEQAESGTISKSSDLRLSYLEQHDPFHAQETVLEFLVRYTEKPEWLCSKIAAQFQLTNYISLAINNLSGGYKTRVKLTAMMLEEPNFLILDEPTNYLDLKTLLLLEQFLSTYNGGFIIVSHDREFLKKTCEYTLDVEHGKLTLYPEAIDNYLIYKEEQQRHLAQQNKNIEAQRKHLENFIDRFRAKASKATQAQAKIKQLEKLKPIETARSLKNVILRIPQPHPRNGVAFECENLAIGYDNKTIANDISLFIPNGAHVAILGDNGQGKTTFLRTIANDLAKKSGVYTWNSQSTVGYYAQHVYQTLSRNDDVYSYLRSCAPDSVKDQEILDMAGSFLFSGDDVNKKIQVLSGGERARLCLAGILLQQYDVLLLDEPTNHLDFETVEALADALHTFKGTVLFISHDRTFVKTVATDIIEVNNGSVTRYPGNYDEYVFYLSQQVEQEQSELKKTVSQNKKTSSASKKETLKPVERQLKKLEKEKKQLEDEFATHPNKFCAVRNKKYKEILEAIEQLEIEWIALQE